MVSSMTAFARCQQSFDWGTLSWEIRSVNHRYLEPGMRLPENLRSLEPKVREHLRQHVSRGKLECQLRLVSSASAQQDTGLDTSLVQQLQQLGEQVAALLPQSRPLSVSEVLKWPGVLQEPDPDLEAIGSAALKLLHKTVQALNEARQREGRELSAMISKRLDSISEIVAAIRAVMPEILKRQQDNIAERLSAWKTELEPSRLEQEMVLLANKSDVDEELDRLETHVTEVKRVLTLNEPVGRRLDFLMQELNREANTLSSKSVVSETTLQAVELKVLIEQMREQIQNIE